MGLFLRQLRALLWKNFLLKRRNKRQFAREILVPISFILLLVLIKVFVPTSALPAVGFTPTYPLGNSSTVEYFGRNILVSPNNTHVRKIALDSAAILREMLDLTYTPPLIFVSDSDQLYKTYLEDKNVTAGVDFQYKEGDNLTYAIRMPHSDTADTEVIYKDQGQCRGSNGLDTTNCMANKYLSNGFCALQAAIDIAIIRNYLDDDTIQIPHIAVQMMPKPKFQPNTTIFQLVSAFFFVIGYSQFVNFLCVNIVAEKEKRITDTMEIMGVKNHVIWLSWGIVYFIIVTIVTTIAIIVNVLIGLFLHSNMFIVFMILLLYGISEIALACLISIFFKKAQDAGGSAALCTILISLLYMVISLTRTISSIGQVSYSISPAVRCLLCLFSPAAFALAIDQAVFLDITEGLNFSTIRNGDLPLYGTMLIMVFDTVLYVALALFIDKMISGNYKQNILSGICRKTSQKYDDREHLDTNPQTQLLNIIEGVSKETKEKSAIRLLNIVKYFQTKDGESVKAVDDFSLELYEGQITCLLGHNGAGKTTLINILCGLMDPSSGNATIYGSDVSNKLQMKEIRKKTGVCAQENILFDDLTCAEQLTLYAGLKGIRSKSVCVKVTKALEEVGIEHLKDTFAKNLSGGQKRKLSVAMALIGDPKILFLDEPTAGMDPNSRRQIWKLLKEKKQDKVILLTTHFMDEADILADRKAIISKGHLKCCGSSLFLKSMFGEGYHLNMLVNQECSSYKVTDVLQTFVPGTKLQRHFENELSYLLPLSDVSRFPELFAELEKPVSKETTTSQLLGIKSYGLCMTTLEELFLKLDEDNTTADMTGGVNSIARAETDMPISKVISNADEESSNTLDDTPLDHKNLKSRQFRALCTLLFLRMIRSKFLFWFIYLLLPVMFAVSAILISKYIGATKSKVPVPLNMTHTIGYYAKVNDTGIPDFVPHLIVRDSAKSILSDIWLEEMSLYYFIDTFSNESEFLDNAPYFVGGDLKSFDLGGFSFNLEMGYTILYNETAVHALPVMISFFSNIIFRTESIMKDMNQTLINTISLPWPKVESDYSNLDVTFSSTLILATAFVIIAPGCAVDLVRDRQTKCRSQLRIAGVTSGVYWASNFCVDIIRHYIPAFITIFIIMLIQVESLSNAGAILSLILTFITFIPASTVYAYVLSFSFSKFDVCQSVLPVSFLSMGLLPFLVVSVLDMTSDSYLASVLHCITCVFDCPYTIFGSVYYIDRIYRQYGPDVPSEVYFRFDSLISITYIMSVVQVGVFLLLLRVLDTRDLGGNILDAFPCLSQQNKREEIYLLARKEESIVQKVSFEAIKERERVELLKNTKTSNFPIILAEDLRKEFLASGSQTCMSPCTRNSKDECITIAVDDLTFAVQSGEVLGLLGPNGAGKSTTLNMMTANVTRTSGTVIVGGYDSRTSSSEAFHAIGYCPQHDALWDRITLKEHLTLYASIKGVDRKHIEETVETFLQKLRLGQDQNKYVENLSGGTKRKLSYALAMVARPKAVLLDEPSTGMDPTSKRFFWNTITRSFSGTDRGAILTTHSMEEADALCSRIGIMINGKLECIGSAQQLKAKYGSGYFLEVKFREMEDTGEVEIQDQYIPSLFPAATRLEKFGSRIQYKIPKENCQSFAKIFSALEEGKLKHYIEEYSFSESTLEQVFLDFTRKQKHEDNQSRQHTGSHKKNDQLSVL